MYIIFSISKILVNIIIVYITFARPFMPEWTKLRAIWVGQSVIYYQLLVYSGLVPGVFGYTIDRGQEGMIKSSRRYFFLDTIPKIDADQDFVVYKFIQNDLIPKILEEALVEVISMVAITVVVLVLKLMSKGLREHKVLRIAREIKSSIYVFSFIPFVVHFTHNLLSISYSKDTSFWSILAIMCGLGIVAIYLNHFFRMAQGISDINFLHSREVYQTGKTRIEQGLDWAFDSYISMDTNVKVRVAELVVYVIFAGNYATGYVIGAFSATVSLLMYIFLLVANLHKYKKYVTGTNERDIQKKITLFSIIHLGLITFNHLIYFFFWIFKGMGLGAVKFWTWMWYIATFADLVIILVQLGFRLYTMNIIPTYVEEQKKEEQRAAEIKAFKAYQDSNREGTPLNQNPRTEPQQDAPIAQRRTFIR